MIKLKYFLICFLFLLNTNVVFSEDLLPPPGQGDQNNFDLEEPVSENPVSLISVEESTEELSVGEGQSESLDLVSVDESVSEPLAELPETSAEELINEQTSLDNEDLEKKSSSLNNKFLFIIFGLILFLGLVVFGIYFLRNRNNQ